MCVNQDIARRFTSEELYMCISNWIIMIYMIYIQKNNTKNKRKQNLSHQALKGKPKANNYGNKHYNKLFLLATMNENIIKSIR